MTFQTQLNNIKLYRIGQTEDCLETVHDSFNTVTAFNHNYTSRDKNQRYFRAKLFTQINLALLKNNLGFHQEAIALLKEVIITYPSINDVPENLRWNIIGLLFGEKGQSKFQTKFRRSISAPRHLLHDTLGKTSIVSKFQVPSSNGLGIMMF